MAISEDKIREVLKQVVDPELFVNVVDLGLIYGIEIRPHGQSAETGSSSNEMEPGQAAAQAKPTAADADSGTGAGEMRATATASDTTPPSPQRVDTPQAEKPAAEQSGATAEPPSAEPDSAAAAGATSERSGDEGAKWDVTIEMTLTSPACPAGPQLIQHAKAVVGRLEGVADVEIKLVMQPPWTPDRMTDEARDQLGIF